MNGLTKIEELEDLVSHLKVDLVHAHQQSEELMVKVKDLEVALSQCQKDRELKSSVAVEPPLISEVKS